MGKKSLRFFHCSLITLPPSFSPPILIASLDHMTYFLLVAIATTSDTIETFRGARITILGVVAFTPEK